MSSRSSRRTRGSSGVLLGGWAVLVYVFLFAPIVLLVLFSFNANRYGTFPFTGWTTSWYGQVFGDYQIKDALSDDDQGGDRGDDHRDGRRDGGGVPARPLDAAVPERRPHRHDAADHDPGTPDRRQPARAPDGRLPHAALAADGGDRAGGLRDAVRAPARRGAAAGLRPLARAGGERPRGEHVQPDALRRPPADRAGDLRRGAVRVHALAGRVHHHAVPDRRPQHAADLHLHAGEVRDHARGERARDAAARRVDRADRPRLRAPGRGAARARRRTATRRA